MKTRQFINSRPIALKEIIDEYASAVNEWVIYHQDLAKKYYLSCFNLEKDLNCANEEIKSLRIVLNWMKEKDMDYEKFLFEMGNEEMIDYLQHCEEDRNVS